jgi:hypothetical protein
MAEYQGREVELDNPFRLPKGSDKKFGVYVKNKKGNVVKVEFGDPNMEIKRDDPERLKNFRARHNCDQKKDKTKAGYWSCKFWEKGKSVSDLLKDEKEGCGCGCNSCMNEDKHNKKDMDPRKHVAMSKKNPGMYCVFNAKGEEVKLFKKKSDAEEYAIKNHDMLMKEQKVRTQVEFDSLKDAIKSVKFHPTRDKGREVAIYLIPASKRTMRTSAERPSGKQVGSVDFLKGGIYTPVTLPNGPFEKILKAKGAKRVATVKNVDGKTKVFKEQKLKATPQKKFRGRSPGVKKTTGHSLRFKVTSKLAQKMQEILSGEDKAELKRYNRLVTSTDIDGDEVVLTFGSSGARTKVTQMLKESQVNETRYPNAVAAMRELKESHRNLDVEYSRGTLFVESSSLTIDTTTTRNVVANIVKRIFERNGVDGVKVVFEDFRLEDLQLAQARSKFFNEKKNPKDTKYYTKTGKIKKSPEDKETGLPKKYVSRMTKADAKQKAAEIKARKKFGKDDPRRYEPTDVDKKYAGTGQKSKHTKKYEKMFGKKGSK